MKYYKRGHIFAIWRSAEQGPKAMGHYSTNSGVEEERI